ncbi:hypothetical protein MRX96_000561 [Rhipicephalus microplus]
MEQPMVNDSDGTRRRLELSPPAAVLGEGDLSDLPEEPPLNMQQPTVKDDGDGTRRRLEPSPPAAVPEQDSSDLPEEPPLWAAAEGCFILIAVMTFLSVVTDLVIMMYLVPSWGLFTFDLAVVLVPIGVVLYKLNQCLITIDPIHYWR